MRPTQQTQRLDPEAILHRLDDFETDARSRGITHATFRRLTEAFGRSGNQRQDVRALLLSSHPDQYQAPLWHIPSGAAQF
ncbi:hypothetical protein OHS81_07270 [Streptomyces sp. NBC_00400]|uniref:hypothetical protein n=1 Tax=Streptomyces sp. NBC_00400 TaxID=2975737 RepID=UPI002E2053CE